jgi:hypothetical protein
VACISLNRYRANERSARPEKARLPHCLDNAQKSDPAHRQIVGRPQRCGLSGFLLGRTASRLRQTICHFPNRIAACDYGSPASGRPSWLPLDFQLP